MSTVDLKSLLLEGSPLFWDELEKATQLASDFDTLFRLSNLRHKAHARGLVRPEIIPQKIRLAIVGGYSFYPFTVLLEHCTEMARMPCEIWVGDFNNYVSEIMEPDSALYRFNPQVVVVVPPENRCRYGGSLSDPRKVQEAEGQSLVNEIIGLARTVHERSGAEVICTNFVLPSRHDLGTYRTRTLGSDWSFRKWVNLELGLTAPPFLHLCDLEFLTHRHGAIPARDDRGWYESKQPGSPALLFDLTREIVHLLGALKRSPKKVLVLDLDNTLWGGVVADDGLEGIEVGDTSPRGEAFKAFQSYIASLRDRGVLLAVASKNDHERAAEVFDRHPEMRLRRNDFVSFYANWEPKSDNLRRMAEELNLGLDSFVFVDDNPAEIEIVRQFAPEVTTILLGPDPAEYVAQLQDCRLFEPRQLTSEDAARTGQYRAEAQRRTLSSSMTDMPAYLESLQMEAEVRAFDRLDVPRLAQLINKSNQFNLTTRRKTEAELLALMHDPTFQGFSLRLKDRFGDHGLISIVIARQMERNLEIETWLMSCRVLKRQVEEEMLNELARIARSRDCQSLLGVYLPTKKNEMVRDFYPQMGFTLQKQCDQMTSYELPLAGFTARPTKIKVTSSVFA